MLTMREPIKLNISDGLPTVSDAFYERIAGSYGVLQADVTPKELLFCLSTPFELPDELGGMTTVAVSNSYSDRRSVTMELVTNVLNRILLSTTPQFTYQDQVYIDSVLYKLGVEDVPLFMKQVQKLSEEHASVEQLVSLYRQELSLRGEQAEGGAAAEERQPEDLAPDVGSGETRERLYLHNTIYDRLQTRELYELVNRFQNAGVHSEFAFHQTELKTSEQFSASRLLELNELRERTTELPRVELHHTVNRFELGDLLPAPQTAEQVLSQAAEAALLSSFEHVFTQRLADRITQTNTWLRLERVLGETVENSVARFQSFHTENSFFFTQSPEAPAGVERVREESTVLRELVEKRTALGGALALARRLRESEGFPPAALVNPPIEAQGELVTEEHETEHTETKTEKSSTRDIAELTRLALERGAVPAPAQPLRQPPVPAPVERSFRTVREIELRDEVERETQRLRETLRERHTQTETTAPLPPQAGEESVSETLRELREHSEQSELQTRVLETLRETTLQNPPAAAASAETAMPALTVPPASAEPETAISPAAPEGAEAPSVQLERELRSFEEKNRERYETLQIEHLRTAEPAPVELDAKKTIEVSKRALEEPEKVLRELRESAENKTGQPAISAEAQIYLQHTDPATRAVLEAAMRRETAGDGAAPVAGLREGSLGEFNAVAMEILRASAPEAETIPPQSAARTPFTQSTKTLLERVGEPAAAAAAGQNRSSAPLPKLSLVHRREQTFDTDELLERLENRSVNATEQTDVYETQTDRRIEEFNKTGTTTRLTTQTTEDVTELVNRTLARQMNEISDKVYRQMEKRLQTERSRRGRL